MGLEQYVSYPFRRVAVEAAVGALICKSSSRFLRKRIPPSLRELAALTHGVHGDPRTLLISAPWSSSVFPNERLGELAIEHEQLRGELKDRYQSRQLPFPTMWAVEAGTSFLLYSLVRGFQPSAVIEIGVGNGQSSYYIVRALQANGKGRLYSFDVLPEAGGLLGEDERRVWDFRLVDVRRSARSLMSHLRGLPTADLCFHDANHGYLGQFFDFTRLWAQLSDEGILISDDVDASYALIDFCRLIRKRPEILIDGRKAVGILSRMSDGYSL